MGVGYQGWLELWPYAVVMIVVASWGLYHFLAPASWREWTGAGLLQAFIIALYAEMYGFPLTIYLLTSALPLDIPRVHSSGHLWATLLGYGASGAVVEMAIGSIFIAVGAFLIIKGWIKIYFSGQRLQTDGIYGVVRHPQYTGILLVIFGQLIHWPTILTLVLAPAIIFAYVRLARREETLSIERFGDTYRSYKQRVPMFIPHWRDMRQALAFS